MKPRVYVETSVLGYLTSWPSGDLIVAGRQKVTRDWWGRALRVFDLIVSELVVEEVSEGDPQAVRERLEVLEHLPILVITREAEELAQALVAGRAVPATEHVDALHIALAATNGIEYLVTWNFKHIANAAMRSKIEGVCIAEGYRPCTICTPEELLESNSDV
jgi:predicted nucleic acid-binding protein